ATKQIAHAYRESGQLPRAAGEYERLSSESTDPAVRGEALLVAGDLYQQSKAPDRALDVYGRYVKEFPKPIETVLEIPFKIAEVTAAATYYMAEIYFDFSRSLAESERPTDLKPADMAEYEAALDEEAFPFEEKAIHVHEKNLELLRKGVFNAWIEKSLGRLAMMMPGRYAKPEVSIGFLGAIDSYVYRSPVSPAPTPGGPAKKTPPAPAAVDDSQVGHDGAP